MITIGTKASEFKIGDQYFEPGIGRFEVMHAMPARSLDGYEVMLFDVVPLGSKNYSVGGGKWFGKDSVLHKVKSL